MSQGSAPLESRPDDLKYLPGAAPFVTVGVIRDLQLSNAQLEKIRRILDYTDKLIAENEDSRSLFDSRGKRYWVFSTISSDSVGMPATVPPISGWKKSRRETRVRKLIATPSE